MKVFLTWSGDRSRDLALFLRVWLRDVVHHFDPWVSDRDVPAGVMWSPEIISSLQQATAGVICVTPENQGEPWVLFEAGALANRLGTGPKVCVYVLGMRIADLRQGPLTLYQVTTADQEGTLKLVSSLNTLLAENRLPEDMLTRSFERCWPEMAKKAESLALRRPKAGVPTRTSDHVLEEILLGVRQISRQNEEIQKTARSTEALLTEPDEDSLSSVLASGQNESAAFNGLRRALTQALPGVAPLIGRACFQFDSTHGIHLIVAHTAEVYQRLKRYESKISDIAYESHVGYRIRVVFKKLIVASTA